MISDFYLYSDPEFCSRECIFIKLLRTWLRPTVIYEFGRQKLNYLLSWCSNNVVVLLSIKKNANWSWSCLFFIFSSWEPVVLLKTKCHKHLFFFIGRSNQLLDLKKTSSRTFLDYPKYKPCCTLTTCTISLNLLFSALRQIKVFGSCSIFCCQLHWDKHVDKSSNIFLK